MKPLYTTIINSNTNWRLTCSFIEMRKRTNQMHFSRKIQIWMHFVRKIQIQMHFSRKRQIQMHFSTATQIAASVACISWPMEMSQCPNYRFCPTQIRHPFHLLLMPSFSNHRECPQISGRKSDFPFTLHKMSPKICGLILSSPDVFLSLSMVISFLSFYLKCIVKHLTKLYFALFTIQRIIFFSKYFCVSRRKGMYLQS